MLIHASTKYYVTSLLELRLWRMPSMYRLVRTQSMTPVTSCRPVLRRILYWVLFSDQVQNSRVPLFCSWTPLGPGAHTGAGIAIVLQHECSKNYLSFGRGKRAGAASQSQSAHAEHMFHANLSHVVHSVCGSGYMGLPRQILRERRGAALSQNARAEHELHANFSHIAH